MPGIPIKRSLERVPGGMMVVPLLVGALITTFAPGAQRFFGSFTAALFSGPLTILAVFFVCMGASIDVRSAPQVLKRGGLLLLAKVGTGMVLGVILGRYLGETPVSSGFFAGISTLAVVAAMNDTNGGLYMALVGEYSGAIDVGAASIMSLESGPFLTMVTLGVAGLSTFPWQTLLGAILPLTLGIVIGNLDHEMRDFLSRATPVLIPFFAFGLGAGLDLGKVWQAGLLGIAIGVATVVVTGIPLYLVDRLSGGTGVAGVAAASTAGNAAAVPAIVAAANPAYQAAAAPATVLVAASVVVTAVLVPLVTATIARRESKRRGAAHIAGTATRSNR